MHGRNRSEYKAKVRDPAVAAALAKKARQWHAVQAELLKNKLDDVSNDTDGEATGRKLFVFTYQLLTVNPDPLWLWNRRRTPLLSSLQRPRRTEATASDATVGGNQQEEYDWKAVELELTQNALQGNPKAYGAWLHRKWVWQQYLETTPWSSTSGSDALLEAELALVETFLQRDERNFHGWNYRRFVVSCRLALAQQHEMQAGDEGGVVADGSWWIPALDDDDGNGGKQVMVCWMGPQVLDGAAITEKKAVFESTNCKSVSTKTRQILEREVEFSLSKIRDNFSNFSAFHYRSKLLPIIEILNSDEDPEGWWRKTLEEELELVESAVFTEPDE